MEDKLTYQNVYAQFKSLFQEDRGFFEQKERETGIDKGDGAHLLFGMVVTPFLYHLADISDGPKIKKCFSFFDEMSTSSDKELSAVVQFSILEDVVSNKNYFEKLKAYFTVSKYDNIWREYFEVKRI